uniref:Uncharacterized protein n=1 Tax=Marseillevirus LCMAC102 TaxID=2506603 RepID=A0A481YU46_9VIRU|nr:MAG: hypothetical protein LCMAC102_02060 [Marseillevirus LCMAC102]
MHKLFYFHNGKKFVLVTFQTLIESPNTTVFGSDQSALGHVNYKALEHPQGGLIYHFKLCPDLKNEIMEWLNHVSAYNIKWYTSIHIKEPIKQGYKICSKIVVG